MEIPSSFFFLFFFIILPFLLILAIFILIIIVLYHYLLLHATLSHTKLRRRPFLTQLLHSGAGPPTYPVIGCLLSYYKNRHRLLSWYTDLLSASPTQTVVICRFGARRTIITANPENVEYMLKTNFLNFPKGKPFIDILADFLGCGIFNVDGDLWHAQRKLASHQFTSSTLKDHVKNTVKEAVETKLFPILHSLADIHEHEKVSAAVVDFQELLRKLGFDIVCKLSLGFDPCCLEDQHSLAPILKAFDTAAEISAKRGAAAISAMWKLKKFFGIGNEKVLKRSVREIHEYIGEIVHERKKKMTNLKGDILKGKDLLSRMLVSGLSEVVIRDMMISFIMAGRDTMSAAMTWFFYVISRHSHVKDELVNEIECYFKDDEIENLKEMRYLQACLCETMRLYPPVSWDSKHAAEDDTLPDGTSVRAGDRVTYFPYGMGRMESLWGKDRLEFRPNRWFGRPDEIGGRTVLKEVSPYKYPVFHAGPRVCLGKELASIQMSYVVASILKRFEIIPVGSDKAVLLPLLTAHMAGGFQKGSSVPKKCSTLCSKHKKLQ